MSEQEKPKRELTPEEMENYKRNLIKFYKDQMELLEPQVKYESALTEIDELRTRRAFAQMKLAQIMAPDPEETDVEVPKMPEVPTNQVDTKVEEPIKRNLKKQEA